VKIPRSIDQRLRLKLLMALYDLNCVDASRLIGVTHQKIRQWTSVKSDYKPEVECLDQLEITLTKTREVA